MSYMKVIKFDCSIVNSFVRSVTMDKWKDAELEKMKAGGNRQCKLFFTSQSDFRENWNFRDKWNSKAAALLRDKIATVAEGRDWSPESSPAQKWNPFNGSGGGGGSSMKSSYSYAAGSNSSMKEDLGLEDDDSFHQKDDYFGDHSNRYQGFGNAPVREMKSSRSEELINNAFSSMSFGWSSFSKTATQAALYAKDSAYKAGQTAAQKAIEVSGTVRDGTILTDVQSSVQSLATKAADYTRDVPGLFYAPKTTLDSVDTGPSEKSTLLGQKPSKNSLNSNSKSSDWGGWMAEEDGDFGTSGEAQDLENFLADDDDYSVNKPTSSSTSGFGSRKYQQVESAERNLPKKSSHRARPTSTTIAGAMSTVPLSEAATIAGPKSSKQQQQPPPKNATKSAKNSDLLIDFGASDVKTSSKPNGDAWDDDAWDILNR